jgi:uncharacterized protein (TIGR00269 family)
MVLCSLCGVKEAIYFRPYSGERLCGSCLCGSIEERVRRTITRFDMFEHDSRIAVGVSGGKDSLSLLHILVKIEEKFPKAELIAVTVDEGIRGYREEAVELAEAECRKLGVEHRVLSFKQLFGYTLDEIAERTRGGALMPCSFCGVLRRRALNTLAREVGADRLATAHNLDDMAQTVLLNILRGDHRRLALLDPAGEVVTEKFVRRVKPYCDIPERESVLYAYLKGIGFQSSPCPHAETAMRSDIRGFLSGMEAKRPGTMFIVFHSALRMLPMLRKESSLLGFCPLCGEPTTGEVCRACEMLQSLETENKG